MTTLQEIWPLFDLRLNTPRLELRAITDEDIPHYVDAALSGIHPADEMPFALPWSIAEPDVLALETARWIWTARADTTPDHWVIPCGVWQDGVLLGVQDLVGKKFGDLHTVETGSWLRHSAQAQGIGKEMRAAVLQYAFDYLGAEFAVSEANTTNPASLGVSHALGYQDNGVGLHTWAPGKVQTTLNLRLAARNFRRPDWTVQVSGHAAVAHFLGI